MGRSVLASGFRQLLIHFSAPPLPFVSTVAIFLSFLTLAVPPLTLTLPIRKPVFPPPKCLILILGLAWVEMRCDVCWIGESE